MLYYWYTILKILLLRNFQASVAADQTLRRDFRVRLFDCDGLRVMTAAKYPVYMDFIRWELIARSRLFHAIVKKGLAPTLGSQKIIYRKPLKRWTKFTLILELAGWDDKWVYHIHTFEQDRQVKAIGFTRSLIWKKDVPGVLEEIIREAGINRQLRPADWILRLFEQDKEIIRQYQPH